MGGSTKLGTNDLLHHHTFRTLELKIRRRGADVDGLLDNAVKLVMCQGAVVKGRGQSESVVDEGDLFERSPPNMAPIWAPSHGSRQ